MNLYVIPLLITDFILLSIGIFVFLKNKSAKLNIIFSMLSFSMAVWLLGYINMYLQEEPRLALQWSRIGFLGIIFIPIFAYHFIVVFLNLKRKIVLPVLYLCAIPALLFSQTDYIYSGVKRHFWGYYPTAGRFYFLFLFMFGILLIRGVSLLLMRLNKESGIRKEQLKYMSLAFGIVTCGIMDYLVTYPILDVYPFGYICALFFNILIGVAIVRCRLMNINLAITRTGLFVAIYALVLGLPFAMAVHLKSWLIQLSGIYWWIYPLGLMAFLATASPYIYIYIDRKTEERLLHEQKRYQQTLKEASVGMTRIRSLKKLLDLISHIVTKTVKISHVAIYLRNPQTDEYILQVSRDRGGSFLPKLASDNPFLIWLIYKREPLIYEEIKRKMVDFKSELYKDLEENMRLLDASLIIPCFLEDKLTGVIVLGDKLSGQIYTPEDLNVFQVLASQAALAIENAQFYEETKQMQEQVAQAEKMATIGTMADGLSHQINNRLYALSLIAGDSIDTIKMTDTSNCAPEIKEMITQINRALERIQSNVIQGGEVVRGLLKYSRQDHEGLEPVNLNTVLNNTLEMVQYKVKLSEIDIVRNFSDGLLPVKGNLVQLEEVFFNLIDNAYDAIVERRTILKEQGYRGRISICAIAKSATVMEVIVEDNGMGIKGTNNSKVFTPFFTTKTSSRKGTGLGLYVIRRIITDIHKGKISFESQHKVGTRFIMELQITNEQV